MSATTASPRHHPIAAVWRAPRSRARARTSVEDLTASPSATENALAGSGSAPGNSHRRAQIGFTGRYLDKETGLWYFRARYYSGSLGRFVSRDPWREFNEIMPSARDGYKDGFNLYPAYFLPNGLDPWGLYTTKKNADGSTTVDVKKCEVIIFHNHGDSKRPHKFKFESPTCSAGIFGGCGAGPTNEAIPTGNSIYGVAGYTDSDEDQVGGADSSQEFLKEVAARGGEADQKADEICKDTSKCCDEVKVHFIGDLPKPAMGAETGLGTFDKVRTLNCKTGAWTYGE